MTAYNPATRLYRLAWDHPDTDSSLVVVQLRGRNATNDAHINYGSHYLNFFARRRNDEVLCYITLTSSSVSEKPVCIRIDAIGYTFSETVVKNPLVITKEYNNAHRFVIPVTLEFVAISFFVRTLEDMPLSEFFGDPGPVNCVIRFKDGLYSCNRNFLSSFSAVFAAKFNKDSRFKRSMQDDEKEIVNLDSFRSHPFDLIVRIARNTYSVTELNNMLTNTAIMDMVDFLIPTNVITDVLEHRLAMEYDFSESVFTTPIIRSLDLYDLKRITNVYNIVRSKTAPHNIIWLLNGSNWRETPPAKIAKDGTMQVQG